MLNLYYSNHLETQKEILIHLLTRQPLADPFQSEQILVQSQGMAQWLKLEIAQKCGIAANISFPLPASFIWQQYHRTLPNVPQQNAFEKEKMQWHLMALIPDLLTQPDFAALKKYLNTNEKDKQIKQTEQQKLYQLSGKIADLFDQYLVYRPEWIQAWEQHNDQLILNQLTTNLAKNSEFSPIFSDDLQSAVGWQGQLWRALYARVETLTQQQQQTCWHRASLQQQYLQVLAQQKQTDLPQRIFIFGISALPNVYLQTLQAMAAHCEVHLFFNNPCRYYWGDILDPSFLQQLKLRKRKQILNEANIRDGNTRDWNNSDWLNDKQLTQLAQPNWENDPLGYLQSGHPLLAAWGKMGRDFLYLLSQSEANEIDAYAESDGDSLLVQLKNAILQLQEIQQTAPFLLTPEDQSLTIHACHSPMREVEILHDQLLHWFQQDPTLTPKDVVVMVADVDKYVPYIHAVFAQYQYQDPRFIPYEIADRKHSHSDVIVATFLELLQLQESLFSAESVLALLDVAELRERFSLDLKELEILQNWVLSNGIRYGLVTDQINNNEPNYNAWQSGLERMLLGAAMRESDGIWQETVAFDASYGLSAQIVGKLGEFLDCLQRWHQLLQQQHSIPQWQQHLHWLLTHFFTDNEQSRYILLFLQKRIDEICQTALDSDFDRTLSSSVVAELFQTKLTEEDNSFHFLNGKLSFCTLLPMRAIPFKVVALLGMNEGDYPRQQNPNSFDLMQYDPQKGDRVRRDDDRYLFLEAILSAQQKLYISYVGRSLIDNQQLQPSVLVSQLLDYLADQTLLDQSEDIEYEKQSEKVRQILLQQHPMTVFSRENFLAANPNRSFAKEWLVASATKQIIPDFTADFQPQIMSKNEMSTADNVIELDRLISFVKSPLAYFFQKQLGVYFKQNDHEWRDSESFALDGLERYQISDDLLQQPSEHWQQQFTRFKLKGELPRAHFADISQQKLSDRLQPLSVVIEPYLTQTAQSLAISIPFEINGRSYQLQGEIGNLYQQNKTVQQKVIWRAGAIKAAYQIEQWLDYLAMTVLRQQERQQQQQQQQEQQQETAAPHFYGLDNNKLQFCTFKPISPQQAREQLTQYLQDFLLAEQKLLTLPTALYATFLAGTKSDDQLLQAIKDLGLNGFHEADRADPYWQRFLAQQQQLDLEEIKAKMQTWFALMQQSLDSEQG